MKIIIPGNPISKTRHRSFVRFGKICTYDAQESKKHTVKRILNLSCIQNSYQIDESPLHVDIIFQMDSFCGASNAIKNIREWGILPCTKKPDLDNLEKFVLDCGNGILWPDDRFIIKLTSKKIYSNKPCTIIMIKPISKVIMSKEQENVFKIFNPDDLREIELDMYKIGKNYEDTDGMDNQDYFKKSMASTADSLIEFTEKWLEKLKKLKWKK